MLRKRNASFLISAISCSVILLSSFFLLLAAHQSKMQFLYLEEQNRIGKMMIHWVWQEIKDKPAVPNQVAFNNGTVHIRKTKDNYILETHLNNGYSLSQTFALPDFPEQEEKQERQETR